MKDDPMKGMSQNFKVLVILVISPIVETLLFQWLPISAVAYFKVTNRNWLKMIVSSLLFASIHYYSVLYLVMAFIGGLIMSFLYIYTEQKHKIPVIYVAFLHFLYNLYGMLFVVE